LPAGVQIGAVWTIRTTMPFNASPALSVNGDGLVSDFVPGTTRAMLEPRQCDRAGGGQRVPSDAWPRTNSGVAAGQQRLQRGGRAVNKSFALGGPQKDRFDRAGLQSCSGETTWPPPVAPAGRTACRPGGPERPSERIWPHQSGYTASRPSRHSRGW